MKSYIIIGAGILGASTAYHLAKAGADVTIIDRKDLGQATDAAAGIVCPWLSQRRNKVWYRLAKGGARYYPSIIGQLKADGETETGYKRVGAISLHTDVNKLHKMMERAEKRREDAPEIGELTLLTSEETRQRFPLLSEEFQAVHVSGAARVDGRAMRDALLNGAKKNGATLRQGDAGLLHEKNRITGVQIADEVLRADGVIVTAGAWAKELFQPLGIDFLVTSQKAQILHLEIGGGETGEWPVVMPPNDQYLLAFPEGKVVAGATHENDVGFDHRVTAGGLHEVLQKATAVAPGIGDAAVVETRVGFRPFTPGFLPVFGAVPGFDDVWVANGLGASGLTVGPYLGSELAKLVMGETTELDPADYDVAGALG
ncbi:NAD(P)/FAD-dependent oxidoreductase [Rossellomorea vietnamensis]|uniref:NAD(P)/FAD-dependent oxidoreductase n=1 Tax=Rossellomorea vietnamensis TaxID=218284 RepID=UPI001E4E1958|nr:FAD-binding oxidoreductase [Rossellomorea vietnamensis]MCC5803287.1 FAD-binding oxidoreductase [Rossellomorea vietnamensis]